jgi:hypothetical protein
LLELFLSKEFKHITPHCYEEKNKTNLQNHKDLFEQHLEAWFAYFVVVELLLEDLMQPHPNTFACNMVM